MKNKFIFILPVILFIIILFLFIFIPRKTFFPREGELKVVDETLVDKKIDKLITKLNSSSESLDTMVELGIYYFLKGPKYYDKAINFLHNAWKLGSTDIRIFYYLGCMYEFLKLYELATVEYTKFLRNLPNDIEVLIRLGNVYYKMNKINEALNCFNKVLQQDKNNIIALANIGFLYFENKNFDKAQEYLLSVVKVLNRKKIVEPKNVNHYLGKIFYYNKNYQTAKEYFLKEQKNYPDNIENSLFLVKTFYQLGEFKDAYDLILQLKEITPKNKELLTLEKEIRRKFHKI